MIALSCCLLTISYLCAIVVNAQTAATVQDDWIFPYNAGSADSPASMTIGTTVQIQWTDDLWAWFPEYAPDSNVNDVDLWITGYDLHQFEHLVASEQLKHDTRFCSSC